MKKFSLKHSFMAVCLLTALLALTLTGCGSASDGTQTYAWPLGTSSPEDTVTQIYAERFAEEVSRLRRKDAHSGLPQQYRRR
jgi:uncharacterized lipoprotein YmbA